MAEWFIGFGAMLIPLAFVIRIWQDKTDWSVYLTLVLGFICLGWGFIYSFRKERSEANKERIKIEMEIGRYEVLMREINGISNSVKDLVSEIRQDRNERNNKPKPNGGIK